MDTLAQSAVESKNLKATVAFRATPTGNTGNLAPSPHTTYTEVFDEGNNFSSGTFTAPYDGIYSFTVAHGVVDSANRVYNRIILNGSTILAEGFSTGVGANHDPIATCTRVVKLSQGDTVQAAYGAETPQTIAGTPTFCGFLIGRTS